MGLAWDTVFPYNIDACVGHLEYGARQYLLDGGLFNRSVVDQTFEILARMKLNPKTDYILDGDKLYINIKDNYDHYTKYRRDYAIAGEVLTYDQFMKQLKVSDVCIQVGAQKKVDGKNRRWFLIDYALLSSRCDVSGFETDDIVPLA